MRPPASLNTNANAEEDNTNVRLFPTPAAGLPPRDYPGGKERRHESDGFESGIQMST